MGKLRIIGGQWRGRKLPVADLPGLRPTADRIRETLFNWLAADIADARCLDLFAGTGALGLEALSRGAAHCSFVDRNREATAQLERTLGTLDARTRSTLVTASCEDFLQRLGTTAAATPPFDIVFLDPPFSCGLLEPALQGLEQAGALAPHSCLYIEHEAPLTPAFPEGWSLYRSKTTRALAYGLLRRSA